MCGVFRCVLYMCMYVWLYMFICDVCVQGHGDKMGACIVQCNKLPAVDSLTVSKCLPSYPPAPTVSVSIAEPGSRPEPASGAL